MDRRRGNTLGTTDRSAVTPAPCRREQDIQRAVFQHIRARGAKDVFAFHPRNGGRGQRTLAGINAGLGVISGVPDVVIIKGGITYALELKTTTGKLSCEQTGVLIEMRRAGCVTGYAMGLDAALAWLEERGILRGKAREQPRLRSHEAWASPVGVGVPCRSVPLMGPQMLHDHPTTRCRVLQRFIEHGAAQRHLPTRGKSLH
jgi:hypothetical protein